MEMHIGPREEPISFWREDGQYAAEFKLPAWAGFRSENSHPERAGENVLLYLETDDADIHTPAIEWFLENQEEIQRAALAAIHRYIIDVLVGKYELDDDELHQYQSESQLQTMVDLGVVRFFPQSRAGEPCFSLELDVNWDPENGCGVRFNGTRVVEIGTFEAANT